MRSFLRVMIDNPAAAVLLAAFALIAGIDAARQMPVDLFPNLDIPVVNIVTHYAGATPEDMELLVSRPIEDGMRSIPGIKRVSSTSLQEISRVTAEFGWGTAISDARQLVRASLAEVAGRLPARASAAIESIGTTLQEVCGYVIYGGSDPVTLLNIIRHDLSGRLMGVKGVSSVEVIGGERRAFYVDVKPEALISHRLTIEDVSSLLESHNLSAVTGHLDRYGREYLIRGDALLGTVRDIRSLPVRKNGADPVLLGAIANVYEGRAPKHYEVHGNGVPAVAMVVRKQPGASSTDVVAGVEEALLGLAPLLPPGTDVKKFYDQSEIIRESQGDIVRDLFIGAILAIGVLYFFLGALRPTLIVAFTIPVTFLATVAIMMWLGESLNVITMTALALSIGMIVDDAIVVAENICRQGLLIPSAREASIEGTHEIAPADASGTFTTVAAFLPLVLVSGLASIFLRPFGLTISSALIVSLLLSLTIVPTLFGRGRRVLRSDEDFAGARLLGRLDAMLKTVLHFSFRHKRSVLLIAFFSLGLAGAGAFLRKAAVLPAIDEGAILIEYVMPPGTSLSESVRIGRLLDRTAMGVQDVSCVYRRTGSPEIGYQIEGVNRGELLIKLKGKRERKRSVDEIIHSLRDSFSRIDGVVFLYHQPTQEKIDESFSGLPTLFGVTLYGTDMNTLASLAGRVETILAEDSGMSNIVNNTKVKVSRIDVRLDYPRLARYGIEAESLLHTLRGARYGIEATRIVRQKEEVPVLVRLERDTDFDMEHLRQLPVPTRRGGWMPLERVADIAIRQSPSAITRLNGQRQITLLAEVKGSISAAVRRLGNRFQSLSLPEGYSIDFTGQYQILIETARETVFALVSAVVLIYLIMVLQFRSRLQPLIILPTIPLSLVGAVIGLFLTRQGMDVSVAMGTLTLVGIAVNNAIVLMEYTNKGVASGKGIEEALLHAASVRLRPILLTSLTTIAALLPTAIGTTVGSRIFQPFAITVIGGLVAGVFATLVIVPTLTAAVFGGR